MIDPRAPDFSNTPASPRRPTWPFRPDDALHEPIVSIVTPFHSPGRVFQETARSVLNQSLQQWEWIVVNDASPDRQSLALLKELRDLDPRIRVIDHERNLGLPAARNSGFREAGAEFVYQLDDDDLIEPTTLEKTLWFLVSHPEYAFANGWSVAFGGREYLWTKGFQQGREFLEENLVTAHAMVRKSAFDAAGGYDETTMRDGFEDWDFWLRCADRGMWGATIPEYLSWYRRRADHGDRWLELTGVERVAAFRKRLRERYPDLRRAFPEIRPREPTPFGRVTDDLPCENRLEKHFPRLLLIVPWLTLGGADRFNLDVTRQLARRGWQITLATTLSGDHSWAPEFGRYTPDIHCLSHFLVSADHPRYLRYLIESRRPDVVLISNSEFAYLILPYLRERCPGPVYLDYCHMEQEEWKNGGYPRHAVALQSCLDLNLVSTHHLKQWMVKRGADPEKTEVVHTNIDASEWRRRPEARRRLRAAWGIGDSEPVVLFAARLCPQKQPQVLARTVLELVRRGAMFRTLIAGSGESRAWLETFLREHHLGHHARLLGPCSSEAMRDVMSASDVFFLPSQWEGIALSLFEAMAMQLAIVGADVGGQSELVTPDCGVLLPRADEDTEVERYADVLASLLGEPARRRELGRRARQRVSAQFSLDGMADRLVDLFERTRAAPNERRAPLPSLLAQEWATQAVEYLRISQLADSLWAVREGLPSRDFSAGTPAGHLAQLYVEEELAWIEGSRSWRTLQRIGRTAVGQLLLRISGGVSGEPELSDDLRERLARIKASPQYRFIQAIKRTPPYRLYARRRYGPGRQGPTPSAQGS